MFVAQSVLLVFASYSSLVYVCSCISVRHCFNVCLLLLFVYLKGGFSRLDFNVSDYNLLYAEQSGAAT